MIRFSAGTGGINLLAGPGDIPTCGIVPRSIDVMSSVRRPPRKSRGSLRALAERRLHHGSADGQRSTRKGAWATVGDAVDMFAKIYIVRSGVDVAEFDTGLQ
jgi:hypothetical protein